MSAGLNTDLALGCCALFVDPCSDVVSVVVLHGKVGRSRAVSWHSWYVYWKSGGHPSFIAGIDFTLTGHFKCG